MIVLKQWATPAVLIILLMGGLAWSNSISKEVTKNSTNIEQQQKQFDKIDKKLDKIVEYLIKQPTE